MPDTLRRFVRPVVLLAAISFSPDASMQAPASCDSSLKPEVGDLGYRPRASRCEGLYREKASAAGAARITLLALLDGDVRYDNTPGTELLIRWGLQARPPVVLRASSLMPAQYYRMDTEVTGTNSFRWPGDIIRALGIGPQQLAVLAYRRARIESKNEIYLPVRVATRAAPGPNPDSIVAILRLTGNFTEHTLTVCRAGQIKCVIDARLIPGVLSQARALPIRIKKKELGAAGIFYVRVSGRIVAPPGNGRSQSPNAPAIADKTVSADFFIDTRAETSQ